MAKSRRRRARQPAEEQRGRGLARPTIWLATLSTVVGVATGMFTLRDQIWPNEAGTASASLGAYQASVGDICDDLNAAERARARDARALARALPKARTTLRQRNLLLDGANRSQAAGADQASRLNGLAVPEELNARHDATVAAWNRNLDRVRKYAHSLDTAGRRTQVVAAIGYLSSVRPALSRDGTAVRSGLVRLGGSACHLEPPIVTSTVTLPPVHKPKPKLKPKPKPKPDLPGPSATATPVATATPAPAGGAASSGSSGSSGSSVNPPSSSGGGATGGGGEG